MRARVSGVRRRRGGEASLAKSHEQRALFRAEKERQKLLGIRPREVRPFAENQCPRWRAQPSHIRESGDGSVAAFVRGIAPVPGLNNVLLKSLQARRESDTFVLDTSVACLFKDLKLHPAQRTPDREMFLALIRSLRLAAPPVAWREYASFGASCAIPFSEMSEEDLGNADRVVESLMELFRRSPHAQWLAMKEQHKLRVKDYRFVVQSAMLYPRTTILTNDSDYGIFKLMGDEIEAMLYRKFSDLELTLSTVSTVNVAYDLGLDVRCAFKGRAGAGAGPPLTKPPESQLGEANEDAATAA